MPDAPTGTLFRVAILLLALAGCDLDLPGSPVGGAPQVCTGYPDPADSPYVLPYPVGTTERVLQGNCGPGGHRGTSSFRYAYDFDMEIGELVTAAREGVVTGVEESFLDGNHVRTDNNFVFVLHPDGTVGRYFHLAHLGALVEPGQMVAQGEPLGRSGNTGNTGGLRHLHFDVALCEDVICETLPVTFRNTRAHPRGLVAGESYTAEPY